MRKTKPSVLEMVFFENWKHFYKTHNWKKKKRKKIREGIWKAKQKRKPQKTEIIDEKKPFKCNFFRDTNAKKQGKKEQQKNKEGKNQQENKEKTKKKQKQDRERQRVKKEKWKKPRRKKGRHWEMNRITRFQGKNSVFIKTKNTNY